MHYWVLGISPWGHMHYWVLGISPWGHMHYWVLGLVLGATCTIGWSLGPRALLDPWIGPWGHMHYWVLGLILGATCTIGSLDWSLGPHALLGPWDKSLGPHALLGPWDKSYSRSNNNEGEIGFLVNFHIYAIWRVQSTYNLVVFDLVSKNLAFIFVGNQWHLKIRKILE